MVTRKPLSRKALFAAALVEAGITAPTFANQIAGVSTSHLYRVLENPRQSAPVAAKIDDFIREHALTKRLALSA